MRFIIYDIETLKTCFLIILHDVDSGKRVCYKISKFRNDWLKMYKHFQSMIKKGYYFVGFNNVAFDAQVMNFILKEERTAEEIYEETQRIINLPDDEKFKELIPEWKLGFKNIDLYKIYHYDNKNKRTSLKWLEYSMRMLSIEEMPVHHSKDTTLEEEDIVESYCNHDIDATLEFFTESKEEIDLRVKLRDEFGIPCLNFNNGKLGMEIILKKYCEKTGRKPQEIRSNKGTFRSQINLANLIYPFISFKTPEFNWVLQSFKKEVWSFEKEKKEKAKGDKGLFTLSYKNSKKYGKDRNYGYVYGYGGLHQCIKEGVYEADDYYCIMDADVSSLYPSLPIAYFLYLKDKYPDNWMEILEKKNSPIIYPEHLGIEALEVYKNDIVDVRLAEKNKPKKEQNPVIVKGYKEAANIPYGKSGEVTSWFYSKSYNLTTTVNGQLLISMLSEALYDIPECVMLQNNTDGITVKIPRKHLDLYYNICKEFEKKSYLSLEFTEYSKMVIINVNNYLAVKINGDVKRKGDMFEIYEDFKNMKTYHKNPSFLVITEALQKYFIEGKDYKEFINTHDNIFNFCGAVKKKGDFEVNFYHAVNGVVVTEKQERVTRFYISKTGGKLIKDFHDGRQTSVVADWYVKVLNTITEENTPIALDDVDRLYYIKEVEKIITSIEGNKQQLTFF